MLRDRPDQQESAAWEDRRASLGKSQGFSCRGWCKKETVLLLYLLVLLPRWGYGESYTREEQFRRLQQHERSGPLVLSSSDLSLFLLPHPRQRWYFSFFAQSFGGMDWYRAGSSGAQAEVAAGAEISWQNPLCKTVVIGGQGRFFLAEGQPQGSAEQWASLCWIAGRMAPWIEFGHHLEWNLRPSFDAPPTLAQTTYTRENILIHWNSMNVDRPRWRFQFGHVRSRVSLLWSNTQQEKDLPVAVEAQIAMIRLDQKLPQGEPGWGLDIFAVGMQMLGGRYSSSIIDVSPVQVRNIPLGTRLVLLDASAGFVIGLLEEEALVNESSAQEEDKEPLVELTTFSLAVALHGVHPLFRWRVGFQRRLYPTLLDQILVENRAEARVTYTGWYFLTATLRGFLAHSTLTSPTHFTREWTGGGELRFTCNAGYGIRVILLHEVARSFYATLQGGLSPLPEWGFRSMLFLSWQWRYPHRRR